MMLSPLFNSLMSLHLDVIDPLIHGAFGGLELAVLTVLLTLVLELCSLPTVRSVLQQTDGPALYRTALWYNLRNHFLLGIPTYAVAVGFLCSSPKPQSSNVSLASAGNVLSVIVLQNLIYYQAHKTFHSTPKLYQYHRFHHRFNAHTPPSAANAVSVTEYMIAYVLPFGVLAALVGATEFELRTAVGLLSVLNLVVHTSRLDALPWPAFLVSPHQHLDHHRKVSVHYASPFLNVDWLLGLSASSLRQEDDSSGRKQ